MFWLTLFAFGAAIGVVSGMLGLGGGVLLVPGLILLFGFSQQEAQGTSLAVLIPPIGIFAAMVYYHNGFIRLPVVGFMAIGFMVGAFLGAMLVPQIPEWILRVVFGFLLLYIGFFFIFNPRGDRAGAAAPAGVAALAFGTLAHFFRRKMPAGKRCERDGENQDPASADDSPK